MKTDKLVKDICKLLDSDHNSSSSTNINDEIRDYDYYLDRGLIPPRFLYYRYVRWEKLDDNNEKSYLVG